MKILVIHGPNLNMLGKKDPQKYGSITLMEVNNLLKKKARQLNCQLEIIQSNHDGVLIDFLQKESSRSADGLLINPGAMIRFNYSFRQAMSDFGKPFVEVHMSDINKTGVNKKMNIFDDLVTRVIQIVGLKENSYLVGLEKLVSHLSSRPSPAKGGTRGGILLIGMKACGKSTVGKLLAKKLNINFIELDKEIEKAHFIDNNERLTFREIFRKHGAEFFRSLENKVLSSIADKSNNKRFVLAFGGGTPLNIDNQKLLMQLGTIVFLNTDEKVLLPRILKHGIPAFFPFPDDPARSLTKLLKKRRPVYESVADKIISFNSETPEALVDKILTLIN